MTMNIVFWWIVVPAAVFGLAYFPLLLKVSPSLASQYPKADVGRRLLAAGFDGLLCATGAALYLNSESVLYLVAGTLYVLLRDALGRSLGKFMTGLMVINHETGLPCTLADSVRRNFLFLLPGANVVAVFLETVTIVRDPRGHRLGDRLAQTQVVVGSGAVDLATAITEWWINEDRTPDRAPVKRCISTSDEPPEPRAYGPADARWRGLHGGGPVAFPATHSGRSIGHRCGTQDLQGDRRTRAGGHKPVIPH